MGRSASAGVVLAVAVGLAGCDAGDFSLSAREDVVVTRPLEPGGRFSLRNTNGRVSVRVWDEPRVRIEAEKAATSRDALDDVRVEVEGEGRRVEVRTRLPHGVFGRRGVVTYRISVPRDAEVDVETVNGAVHVEGVAGPLRASSVNGSVEVADAAAEVEATTVNGSLRVAFESVRPRASTRLRTTNGSLTLSLPAGTEGDFEARTVNGRVKSDFPLQSHGRFWVRRLSGRVGDGSARFELRAVNGSVTIRKREPA
jgi:DUF4097 and DUF4098 domain-containing protein YvlB